MTPCYRINGCRREGYLRMFDHSSHLAMKLTAAIVSLAALLLPSVQGTVLLLFQPLFVRPCCRFFHFFGRLFTPVFTDLVK